MRDINIPTLVDDIYTKSHQIHKKFSILNALVPSYFFAVSLTLFG